MLTQLFVKDLAIVSTLELELAAGMTALTGETGAGKSILIDALGLALGDKADNAMIRAGCERAEIGATFDLTRHPTAAEWLADNGLDEGSECILRRLLVRDGRSRTFVNGRPVPLQQLQALGVLLVDIHGQHAHQSLLRPTEQRRLLDAYAGAGDLAQEVAGLFRAYRAARERLDAINEAARDRASRMDLLTFQHEELETLAVTADELRALDEEQRRLHNIGRLQETAGRLVQRLYEDEQSLQSELTHAVSALDDLLEFSSALREPRDLVEAALIQIQEAAAGLRDFADGLEPDPARLEQVDQRLADIHDAARKYRVEPEGLPERLAEIRRELSALEGADQEQGALEQAVATLRTSYLEAAGRLGIRRREAAERLAATVTASMQTLGMGGGRFELDIGELPEEKAGAAGLEAVEFLVSANPGQPLQPLARVASGGELSRVSLAIQVATAECGEIPTLIFDEVDVGIGGGVAQIVGRLLRDLGAARQVLCVTHLPQVASQAHRHLRVKKYTRDGETYTGINPLSEQERVEEIARMLGGVEITDKTRDHAREMVETARA